MFCSSGERRMGRLDNYIESLSNNMMTSDPYGYCKQKLGSNASTDALLQCVSNIFKDDIGAKAYSRTVLVVLSGALVFFMQAGFAMVCAGAVRTKNVQNSMLKNLMDACGASLAFFFFGYAFAFGGDDLASPNKTFIGTKGFALVGVEDYAFFMFEYAFSAASVTIVAGTLAERCQMAAYLCYSIMLSGWVYPVVAHQIWSPNGFLSALNVKPLWGVGMMDFAGSGVVHVTGGITALFAAIILGPRRGRFHDDAGRRLETPRVFAKHSVALQMLGTFILWFGWYGFNPGSALVGPSPYAADLAAIAAVNSTLSAGSAAISALFLNLLLLERYTGEPYFDLDYLMNGSLIGMVSITAGCALVEPFAAVIIGLVAGIVYILGVKGLLMMRIDDAVDAVPVHLCGGVWGLIAVGLFAAPKQIYQSYGRDSHPGLFYSWSQGRSDGTLLACQVVGLLFILGWVVAIMLPFFVWLDWKGWFRSDPLEEIVGLDTSYHGGLALISNGSSDDVNPEYITAYKEKRAEGIRRRKGPGSDTTGPTTKVAMDDEENRGDLGLFDDDGSDPGAIAKMHK